MVRNPVLLTGIGVGVLVIVALVGIGEAVCRPYTVVDKGKLSQAAISKPAGPTPAQPSACAANETDREVIVSISKRHLWACQGAHVSYDSPVVTGMETKPADLTPVGTYLIRAKYTDQVLRGSDSTGSWNDPVSYWMPFLTNQYGTYGFHDATWRNPTDFGAISPYSSKASHGCVELPLATAKWLYGWAAVGTKVLIEA